MDSPSKHRSIQDNDGTEEPVSASAHPSPSDSESKSPAVEQKPSEATAEGNAGKENSKTTEEKPGEEKKAEGVDMPEEMKEASDEHLKSPQELSERHQCKINLEAPDHSEGLSVAEARRRLEENGKNELTPPKQKPEWLKYLLHLADPFLLMLLAAAVLSFVAFAVQSDELNAYLGGVLIAIILLNGTISYLQERKTGKVMGSIGKLLPQKCMAFRGGDLKQLPASDLVVGDVIRIRGGDRIPADTRLFSVNGLKVENSSLTGESVPITATVEPDSDEQLEAHNVVFNSSMCVEGEGFGIVIRTGDDTLIGQIAKLTTSTTTQQTTLQREINRFVKFVSVLAVSMAVIFFIVGVIQDRDLLDVFVLAFVAVLVANVPQGLPPTVTSALTIAAKRMQKKNVFVKRLDSVEGFGSASCICSDKTGTLTCNVMTVQNFWFNGSFEMLNGGHIVGKHNENRSLLRPKRHRLRHLVAEGENESSNNDSGNDEEEAKNPAGSESEGDEEEDTIEDLPGTSIMRAPSTGYQGRLDIHQARGWYTNPLEPILMVCGLCNQASFEEDEEKEHQTRIDVDESPGDSKHGPPEAEESKEAGDNAPLEDGKNTGDPKPPTKASAMRRQASAPDELKSEKGASAAEDVKRSKTGISRSHTARPAGSEIAKQSSLQVTEYHDPRKKVMGNASDAAMLRYCDLITPISVLRDCYRMLGNLPFNSTNKFALSVVQANDLGTLVDDPSVAYVLMKGAPEIVMGKCSTYMEYGGTRSIDELFQSRFQRAYRRFAGAGQRVLGCAMAVVPAEDVQDGVPPEILEGRVKNLTFMGLVSLMDPPKDGVLEAINACHTAGIKVFMVTGDHALTAKAIAEQVGIITKPTRQDVARARGVRESEVPRDDDEIDALVVTGAELRAIKDKDDPEWDFIFSHDQLVFARTSPQQKLDIVEQCQKRGHIVAVTGDGVNDSPALKQANIGVAMGSPDASDVARDAADIVLMDDNFASIVSACEEGRLLFDNLKKSIAYTLTHLLPEILPVLLNIAFQLPLGLSPLQILSIDLGTELLPAISLAYEKAEDSIMLRPPRDMQHDHLVNRGLIVYSYLFVGVIEAITCMMAYFSVYWEHGISLSDLAGSSEEFWSDAQRSFISNGIEFVPDEQETIADEARAAWFIALVGSQAIHIFMVRSRFAPCHLRLKSLNTLTIAGIALELALTLCIVYVPFLQDIFSTAEPPAYVWLFPFAFGIIVYFLTEYLKRKARKRAKKVHRRYGEDFAVDYLKAGGKRVRNFLF